MSPSLCGLPAKVKHKVLYTFTSRFKMVISVCHTVNHDLCGCESQWALFLIRFLAG